MKDSVLYQMAQEGASLYRRLNAPVAVAMISIDRPGHRNIFDPFIILVWNPVCCIKHLFFQHNPRRPVATGTVARIGSSLAISYLYRERHGRTIFHEQRLSSLDLRPVCWTRRHSYVVDPADNLDQ